MLNKSIRLFACLALGILLTVTNYSQGANKSNRIVKNNTIVSDTLPKINVSVGKEFKYLGRFPFKIRDVAAGERFVFADSENCRIKRLFIAQFEGFYPHIDNYYRYSFSDALTFGSHKFRHNPYAFSNKESIENNPNGESALTEEFLGEKGFTLEDELMMYRYITVPDKEKKHEMILFYLENVSDTKHTLADFYKDDKPTEVWKEIYQKLQERSLKSFKIVE